MSRILGWLLALIIASGARAEKQIAVYVGLADNATQGIARIGARIGDGNKPDDNLYWGCTDGLKSYFKASAKWKLEKRETDTGDPRILERLVFRHVNRDAVLVAEAWRGANLRDCYEAFQQAGVSGRPDFVAFIGHNVLMDGAIPPPSVRATRATAAAVLCCKSESYFRERLENAGLRPVLLTTQLMYPGSFLLHEALECWLAGKDRATIRAAAGAAYARNQHLSVAAATGVFANLEKPCRNPVPVMNEAQAPKTSAIKIPRWLVVASVVAIPVVVLVAYLPCRAKSQPSSPVSVVAANEVRPALERDLTAAGLRFGDPVFLRIFKEERVLELWVRQPGKDTFQHFRSWPVAAMSGSLGPKTAEGDCQAPEGFYFVANRHLNPNSSYHLSFNLGYPNAYDQAHGYTGSNLMVHGSDVSIGCFAMTDAGIDQIYTLCAAALQHGQPFFRVHIFPFHMSEERMTKAAGERWEDFWKNLKEGHDLFEQNHVPPEVTVKDKRYVFTLPPTTP